MGASVEDTLPAGSSCVTMFAYHSLSLCNVQCARHGSNMVVGTPQKSIKSRYTETALQARRPTLYGFTRGRAAGAISMSSFLRAPLRRRWKNTLFVHKGSSSLLSLALSLVTPTDHAEMRAPPCGGAAVAAAACAAGSTQYAPQDCYATAPVPSRTLPGRAEEWRRAGSGGEGWADALV